MEKLSGDYIAGFVDGEGCFALKFIRSVRHDRKNKPIYFYWAIEFAIMLRADDIEILESIQYTLNCGRISTNESQKSRYSVSKLNDLLTIIVPFFGKYPLHTKKRFDYLLWVEALLILKRNQQKNTFGKINMNEEDFLRLGEIHKEMGEFKSKSNKEWKWLVNKAP